jgi:thiol-disulfide isomerase/thioredoxin
MTGMRASLLGLTLVALAALLAPSACAATPRIGAAAPPLVLRALDGRELDLARQPGEVVVVNVWATWCAPCRAEMPMLNAFAQQHAGEALLLVGVSADRTRDKGDVRKAMSAFAYPAGLLSEAKVDELDPPRVLPLTYVVDKSGVVRAVFGGTGTPLTAELLEDAVRPLL